ncbi:MAG: hypothetical protein JNM70_13085 [Anaerolineae bacterium]|nr:hypothetical protein [Anaerolineae bacterium]
MKKPPNPFAVMSFVAVIIAFFFMAAALLDEVTFLSVRSAVLAAAWMLVALWCQREAR